MIIIASSPVGLNPCRGSEGWSVRVKDSLFSTLLSELITIDTAKLVLSRVNVDLSRLQSASASVGNNCIV